MKNSNALIEIKNLTYQNIFHHFNLTIPKEKMIAIAGTNSSGKSTLIKIIGGLIAIKDTVLYKNIPFENINKKDLFQEIGAVILEDRLEFKYDSVEEELFNILENVKMEQKLKIKQYQNIIKLLKIENILTENPNQLNRNAKIKLLLAAVLISQPKVLLLDDICSMMTKNETKEILTVLKKLNKKEKITIIMTTDNLDEVIDLDYLYILDQGKIALEGEPVEVLKQDNKINKLGLSIPFMIDLSVKLNDYDLVKDIITDMDRMVEILWK